MTLEIEDRIDILACKVSIFGHVFSDPPKHTEFTSDEMAGFSYLANEIAKELREISDELGGNAQLATAADHVW